MNNKFPKVNYIGNKQKLTSWILESLPTTKNNTVLDLFSGGSSVSYELKKNNYRVISNDALYASFVLSKALIENKKEYLESYHIIEAVNLKLNTKEEQNFMWLAQKLYFPNEIIELTQLVKYSNFLNGYRKYMFLALLRRAMIRKLPYSRMNITWDNIVKLRDEEYSYKKYGRRRAYHNIPFFEHMLNDLENYNQSIFDNNQNNLASQMDAHDALLKFKDVADIVYIDPPYPGTMNNYYEFYGIFDELFDKSIPFQDLTNKKSFSNYFENLIKTCSKYYSHALISLNTNVKPSYTSIIEILGKYGSVITHEKKHNYQISGKANKNSNNEILVVVSFN